MDNPTFIEQNLYGPGAHQPMYYSRQRELKGVREWAKHYGREITESEFDTAIANRFGDGCEYEWAKD